MVHDVSGICTETSGGGFVGQCLDICKRSSSASQCSHFREFTRPALNLRGPSKIDPAKKFWMIFWAWSSLTGKFRSCSTKPGAGTTVEKSLSRKNRVANILITPSRESPKLSCLIGDLRKSERLTDRSKSSSKKLLLP